MKIFFDETQKERGKIDTNLSILRDALRGEGFEIEQYNNFPITEKSLKCDIFVFPCPDGSKLGKNEIDALYTFLEHGGGLLVIGNAGGDRGLGTNLNELLNKIGIEIISDQVKDESNNEFNMPTHPVIKDIKEHQINQGVAEIAIVAGCSVRGSSNMRGIAYTSPTADPPSAPVVIAGEYKNGRIVTVGSYRLFSNYGAGLSLRNNRTFALNIFKWLARMEVSRTASQPSVKKEATVTRIETIVPPKTAQEEYTSKIPTRTPPPPPPVSATAITSQQKTATTMDQSFMQELERLRSEISEMREIIARLYSDSLAYLQEMREEVRTMLDYLRTKEG